MSHKIIMLSLSLMAALLIGCSTAPLQKGFGTSSAHNEMAQVVNPDAGKDTVADVTLDGQKSERLLKSYRSDSGKAATSSLIDVK